MATEGILKHLIANTAVNFHNYHIEETASSKLSVFILNRAINSTSASGINIKKMGGPISVDVRVDQCHLAFVDTAIAILQLGSTVTKGFDLTAGQNNPSFVGLFDLVVETSLAVDTDSFIFRCCWFGHAEAFSGQLKGKKQKGQMGKGV